MGKIEGTSRSLGSLLSLKTAGTCRSRWFCPSCPSPSLGCFLEQATLLLPGAQSPRSGGWGKRPISLVIQTHRPFASVNMRRAEGSACVGPGPRVLLRAAEREKVAADFWGFRPARQGADARPTCGCARQTEGGAQIHTLWPPLPHARLHSGRAAEGPL